jgi:hypothetical protein
MMKKTINTPRAESNDIAFWSARSSSRFSASKILNTEKSIFADTLLFSLLGKSCAG